MNSIENNELPSNGSITFLEFKSWLTGLVRGKGGALPDLDDWKEIKAMLDRVDADVGKKATSLAPTIEVKPALAELADPTVDWDVDLYNALRDKMTAEFAMTNSSINELLTWNQPTANATYAPDHDNSLTAEALGELLQQCKIEAHYTDSPEVINCEYQYGKKIY